MIDTKTAPYAALILRVSLGILFLAHAGLKFFVFTPAGAAAFFGSLGLPGWFAYVVMLAEAAGGVALILGIYTRIVAIALIPILAGAIVMVHGAKGFYTSTDGWEFLALWIAGQLALAAVGDGPYALKPTPAKVKL